MEFLHLCRVNIFKFTVLMGTFALAMAFAGNDLVNFIGVPLAGLSSYQDYMANANGAASRPVYDDFLMESAKTTPVYPACCRCRDDYRHGDFQEGTERNQDFCRLEPSGRGRRDVRQFFCSPRDCTQLPGYRFMVEAVYAKGSDELDQQPFRQERCRVGRECCFRRGSCSRQPGTCFYAHHHRYQPEVASLYHLRYLHGGYGFFTCR